MRYGPPASPAQLAPDRPHPLMAARGAATGRHPTHAYAAWFTGLTDAPLDLSRFLRFWFHPLFCKRGARKRGLARPRPRLGLGVAGPDGALWRGGA